MTRGLADTTVRNERKCEKCMFNLLGAAMLLEIDERAEPGYIRMDPDISDLGQRRMRNHYSTYRSLSEFVTHLPAHD